ncbi:MAG: hypothetical protein NXY57DRAFT_1065509 [Lentinula lateritia]|nr:MAG: hypothetical protein NXY57DRAFT_1065509 [Lentinula lateritia]
MDEFASQKKLQNGKDKILMSSSSGATRKITFCDRHRPEFARGAFDQSDVSSAGHDRKMIIAGILHLEICPGNMDARGAKVEVVIFRGCLIREIGMKFSPLKTERGTQTKESSARFGNELGGKFRSGSRCCIIVVFGVKIKVDLASSRLDSASTRAFEFHIPRTKKFSHRCRTETNPVPKVKTLTAVNVASPTADVARKLIPIA